MDAALAGFLGSKLGVIENQLGRVQTAGGWAGAVFDGCGLEDGVVRLLPVKIEIGTAISGGDINAKEGAFDGDYSTFWGSTQTDSGISGVAYIGKDFSTNKIIDLVKIKQHELSAYGLTSVKFQVWNGSAWVDVQTLSLALSADIQVFNISSPVAGTKARLLANANTTSGSWRVYEVGFYKKNTTGTATLDISPSSLYAWRNLYFKTKKPENTNIACAVKDTYDNVLIPNIADGGDLSSIDPTQYKTLRLVWTLTRNSVEDESPELHEPFWSWLGGEEKQSVVDFADYLYLSQNDSKYNAFVPIIEYYGGSAEISLSLCGTTGYEFRLTIDNNVTQSRIMPHPSPARIYNISNTNITALGLKATTDGDLYTSLMANMGKMRHIKINNNFKLEVRKTEDFIVLHAAIQINRL